MIRRRPVRRRALVALLLLTCILAGGMLALQRAYPDLLVQRMAGGQDEAPPARATENAPDSGQPASAPPPESRFAVIALRPLFSPDRRPSDQPGAPATAASGGAPTDLLVTGIVMAGEDSVAILEPVRPGPQADPGLVARIGDGVAGWTVEAIEPGRVVLVRDGERHEMALIDEDDPRRSKAGRRAPAPNRPRLTPSPPRPQQPVPQPQPQPQPAPQPQSQPAPNFKLVPQLEPPRR